MGPIKIFNNTIKGKCLQYIIMLMLLGLLLTQFVVSQKALASKVVLSTVRKALIQNVSKLVVKEAYTKLGYEVVIIHSPGLRSIVETNKGRYDGEISRIYSVTKKYPNLMRIEVPVNKIQATAFVQKSSKISTKPGWKSLRPYRVAIHRGTIFSQQGTKGFPNLTEVGTHKAAFLMLQKSRIDAVACPLLIGEHMIKQLGLKNVRANLPILQEYNLYHYLHKKNKHLIPKITKVLQQMALSGRIREIRKNYIGTLLATQITKKVTAEHKTQKMSSTPSSGKIFKKIYLTEVPENFKTP